MGKVLQAFDGEVAAVKRMLDSGKNWNQVTALHGHTEGFWRRRIPEYRDNSIGSAGNRGIHKVTEAAIALRMAEIPPDTRGLTARLLGDPVPGRSALDKKRERSHVSVDRVRIQAHVDATQE